MMTLKVGDVVTEIGGPERLVKIAPSVARYEASVRWKVQRFVHSDMVVCRQIKRRRRQVKYFRLGEIQLAPDFALKMSQRQQMIQKHLWSFSDF